MDKLEIELCEKLITSLRNLMTEIEANSVDTEQLAESLQIKPSWIRNNISSIPHMKVGAQVRFDLREVRAHFRANR